MFFIKKGAETVGLRTVVLQVRMALEESYSEECLNPSSGRWKRAVGVYLRRESHAHSPSLKPAPGEGEGGPGATAEL